MAQSESLPAYLNGWHLVSFSADISSGQILSRRIFGQDVVVFRNSEGQARVLDAHCPHLGAHLGKGGQVIDGILRCPFHGWRFDGNGQCVEVPFTDSPPSKAKIPCWPVHEVNGGIYIWYHHTKKPPSYSIPAHPAFDRKTGTVPVRGMIKIRSQLQELAENTVDLLHFTAVHTGGLSSGVRSLPRMNSIEKHDHELHLRLETKSQILGQKALTQIFFRLIGPSLNLTYVNAAINANILTTTTPVNEEEVRFYYMVRSDIKIPLVRQILELFIASMIRREVKQDKMIWENKIYIAKPLLSASDGPIMAFRKWIRQFYPETHKSRTQAKNTISPEEQHQDTLLTQNI